MFNSLAFPPYPPKVVNPPPARDLKALLRPYHSPAPDHSEHRAALAGPTPIQVILLEKVDASNRQHQTKLHQGPPSGVVHGHPLTS